MLTCGLLRSNFSFAMIFSVNVRYKMGAAELQNCRDPRPHMLFLGMADTLAQPSLP
jgi:hypothetical protein